MSHSTRRPTDLCPDVFSLLDSERRSRHSTGIDTVDHSGSRVPPVDTSESWPGLPETIGTTEQSITPTPAQAAVLALVLVGVVTCFVAIETDSLRRRQAVQSEASDRIAELIERSQTVARVIGRQLVCRLAIGLARAVETIPATPSPTPPPPKNSDPVNTFAGPLPGVS